MWGCSTPVCRRCRTGSTSSKVNSPKRERRNRGNDAQRRSRKRDASASLLFCVVESTSGQRSRMFLKDRCTEFIETKELKDPLAVEVEHSQIIGLMQIALDRLKMPAVALPSERHWNLKCDELADPFVLELLDELRIV